MMARPMDETISAGESLYGTPTAGQPGEAKMERERFEKWEMDTFGWEALDRMTDAPDAYYCDSQVQHDWGVWQAAATPPGAAGQAVDWHKAAEEIDDLVARWIGYQTHGGKKAEFTPEKIADIIARHAAPLPEQAAVEKMARAMPLVCGKCGSHNWEQIAVGEDMKSGGPVRRYRCRPCGNEWNRAALHGEG